jgi:hypothetical protein
MVQTGSFLANILFGLHNIFLNYIHINDKEISH